MKREPQIALAILLGFSGLAGLIYEVTWVRLLGLVFGTSTFAVSTVLTVFMGGLALGSWWGGERADRASNALRLYAYLEAGIGFLALLVPAALAKLGVVQAAAYHAWHPGFWSLTLLRFLLSSLVLLPPTILMGGTFPVMARALVREETHVGRCVGVLYGANTLGAVLGCFGAGFFLIEALGLSGTIRVAASVNILIALTAYLMASTATDLPGALENTASKNEAGAPPRSSGQDSLVRLTLGVIALSGLVALACEVIWSRLLTLSLGSTVYAFSTMLTTLLCGLAAGGFCGGRIADRCRSTLGALGLVEAALGLVLLWQVRLFPAMPHLSAVFYTRFRSTWWHLTGAKFLLSFIVLLLPAFLMGMAFPLAGKVYMRAVSEGGHRLGRLYGANTAGALVGSLLAGFVLIPELGTRGSLLLLGGLSVLLGCLLIAFAPSWTRRWKGSLTALGLVGSLVGIWSSPSWDLSDLAISPEFRDPGNRMLYAREGATATVTAFERPDGMRCLEINARNASLTEYSSVQTFRLLGHLPLLFHPRPRRALVVAFGAGMTLGSVARHPVSRIDCVEICPEVLGAAPYFQEKNYGVWKDPRVHLIIEDGRNYLLMTAQRYDCITSDPIHPIVAGNGNLYSREYFELCRSRLSPGGIVCQWLPVCGLSPDHYRMIVATFRSVFPQSSLWFAGDYSVLLGSPSPLRLDLDLVGRKLARESIGDSLEEVRLGSVPRILKCLVLGPEELRRYARGTPILEDDYPLLEFAGSKLLRDQSASIVRGLIEARQPLDGLVSIVSGLSFSPRQRSEFFRRVEEAQTAYLLARQARYRGLVEKELESYQRAVAVMPEDEDSRYWLTETAALFEQVCLQRATEAMQRGSADEALDFCLRLTKRLPGSSAGCAELGLVYNNLGRLSEALSALNRAITLTPGWAVLYSYRATVYVNRREFPLAVDSARHALALDPNLARAHITLAAALHQMGRRSQALTELEKALRVDPSLEEARHALESLRRQQRPQGAADSATKK